MPHFKRDGRKWKRGELPRCERSEAKFQGVVAEETMGFLYEKKKDLDSNYMMVVFKYEDSHVTEGFFWTASKA